MRREGKMPKKVEWTRPYHGLTHFDMGNRKWATIQIFTPRHCLVTFWDKDQAAYFTAAAESKRSYRNLETAKADGEAWATAGVVLDKSEGRCPTCGHKIAS
jgi:hypothetical protein